MYYGILVSSVVANIIIFIPLFVLSFHYHRVFLFLVGYHWVMYRKQPIVAWYFEPWYYDILKHHHLVY